MPSHLMRVRNGRIFIDAATSRDIQTDVVRRAARIALKKNQEVSYNILNREEWGKLTVEDAKKIMTARLWIEELRDPFSGPLSRKETNQITENMKMKIIEELKKERKALHSRCLDLDKEIKKTKKSLNI